MTAFSRVLLAALVCSGVVTKGLAFQQLVEEVQDFGAIGDGVTDDTAAIQSAMNALPSNATLDFGSAGNTYLISNSLVLRPNATYSGGATIKMNPQTSGPAMVVAPYGQAYNITITGLVLDGGGVAGGINLSTGGGAAIPADNIQIDHVTFQNMNANPRGGGDSAIYEPVGITDSVVSNNIFTHSGAGILLTDAENVQVENNQFDTITQQDAIYMLFLPNPLVYGDQITISGNQGQNLGRMAIELWGPGGGPRVNHPIITQNVFQNWSTPNFGISVMVGGSAQITDNFLIGGQGAYGIELGAPYSLVSNNVITGFSTGIVIQSGQLSTISKNLLTAQSAMGIEISNAAGSKAHLTITQNYIQDSQLFGIFTNTADWGGTVISGNTFLRNVGAWPSDTTGAYNGLSFTPPSSAISVTGNTFTSAGKVMPGFRYVAIQVNGSLNSNAGSAYESNSIGSQLPSPFGIGFNSNEPGSMSGMTIENNSFANLAQITGGPASAQIVSAGNTALNCAAVGPTSLGW